MKNKSLKVMLLVLVFSLLPATIVSACEYCIMLGKQYVDHKEPPIGIILAVEDGNDEIWNLAAHLIVQDISSVVTNRLETDPVRVAFLENAPESQDIQSTIDALTDDGYTALLIIPLSSSSYSTAVHNLAVNIGVARCAIEAHEHNASDRIQSIVPVALTTALDFNEHTAQYYLSTLAGVDCGDKECSLIFVVDAVADDELATRNERIMEQYAKLLEELDVKIETSQLVIFDKNEDRFADQMKLTLSEAKEHESTPVIINHSILFPYEMSDGIVDSLITVGYSPDNYVIVGDGLFWDYSFHLWLVSQIFEPNFLIYY